MNLNNIDSAVVYMKILIDKSRCVTCDLLHGPIIRYSCGHPVCKSCVQTADDCLFCLSPPIVSTNYTDEPYSQRIKHVSHLLTTFQDLFNLDVYKRHRLSEQLKLEKELFPKCIQAPSKYFNKRKSLKGVRDKENSRVSFMAGESITNVLKMENTISYVKQWLKNNESSSKNSNINLPRKPFADLNVNDQSITNCSLVTKVNNTSLSSRKRTHLKIIDSSRKKKKFSSELTSPRDDRKENLQKSKCEKDESEIVNVEKTIVIDNSQGECADKDKLALIAIKEAEKFNSYDYIKCDKSELKSIFKKNCNSINFELNKNSLYKIPFYKKSLLYEVCNNCTNENNMLQNEDNTNNLSVTIDNNKLITTITFSQCPVSNIEIVNKKSVQIQTDACIGTDDINTHSKLITDDKTRDEKEFSLLHQENIKSADLFIDDVDMSKLSGQNYEYNSKNTRDIVNVISLKRDNCLVIEESDTDSDISVKENSLEVTAEVHRAETFEDFGVLSPLERNEYESRMKRSKIRGNTPVSTDSSDKENYDPNRMKRQKFSKKQCSKK